MSNIRPLATVAILAALGYFLATRINEGPIASTASLTGADEWSEAPAYDSSATAGDAATIAPSFGDAQPFASEASALPASPTTEGPQLGLPSAPPALPMPSASPSPAPNNAAPAMPELPPLPTLPAIDPTTAGLPGSAPPANAAAGPTALDPNNLPDLPLPENIPAANYGDASPEGSAGMGQVSGRVPGFGTATSDLQDVNPVASSAIAPGAAEPPQAALTPPAFPTQPLPAPPGQPATAGLGQPPAAGIPAVAYSSARVAIQAALDRDELPRAHLLLSQWYGDPTLSSEERREVDRLLGQLAGSVIYSNEHRLEPPHQVQVGETLESIANAYNVPWQLLAKINGVPRSDAVEPGQILKVVRGPFNAVVDMSDSEVFLSIDGRYAGRFPAQLDGAATTEGAWKVADKASKYEPASPASDAQGYSHSLRLSSLSPATPGQLVIQGVTLTPSTENPAGRVSVAARDLGDLFDILSLGSEVTIRK